MGLGWEGGIRRMRIAMERIWMSVQAESLCLHRMLVHEQGVVLSTRQELQKGECSSL